MSQTSTTVAAPSSFQIIFDAALKSYQKQTKKDLLAHPLVSQLQSCDSTTAILTLLKEQICEFDRSQSGDERLTRWLGPTVNVLFAFSSAVSGGVSLVSLYTRANLNLKLSFDIPFQVFSPASVIFAGIGVFVSASFRSIFSSESFSHSKSYRPPRMFPRV